MVSSPSSPGFVRGFRPPGDEGVSGSSNGPIGPMDITMGGYFKGWVFGGIKMGKMRLK